MAVEQSIALRVGDMREAVLAADTTVRAFGEALGDADWPFWLHLMHRQVLAIVLASEALEEAVNRVGSREVCQ